MLSLTLYHGNTRSVVEEVCDAKCFFEKYKSTGDSHFLGDGFYFYHDPVQAEVWARMKVARNPKYIGEDWAVLKCTVSIDDNKFLDLDNREEQNFFFTEMHRLYEQLNARQLALVEYNDAYLCNHIASITGVEIITKTFPYIDREEFFSPKFSNEKLPPYSITRHFRTEKQYVIRNSIRIESYDIIKTGRSRNRKRGAAK